MTATENRQSPADIVFEVIRTRRTVRSFNDVPLPVANIRRILESARWASSAGNLRLHRYFVTRDPATIDLVSAVSPGFYGSPPALIVICTNLEKSRAAGMKDGQAEVMIDVGTAAMNMQVMSHALGLGTTPVTSFSRSGVSAALSLPAHMHPELILQLGYPATGTGQRFGSGRRISPEDITDWEEFGGRIPSEEG